MNEPNLPPQEAVEEQLLQTVPNRRAGPPADLVPVPDEALHARKSLLCGLPPSPSPRIPVSVQADAASSHGDQPLIAWPEVGQELCGFSLIAEELGRGGFSRALPAVPRTGRPRPPPGGAQGVRARGRRAANPRRKRCSTRTSFRFTPFTRIFAWDCARSACRISAAPA